MALSKMSKSKILFVCVTMLLLALVPLEAQAVKPTSKPNPLLKGAYRVDKNGWIYVHLEGTPFQIGYQNGYLLWDNINTSISATIHLYYTEDTFGDWWFEARDISRLYIWPKLTAEMKVEIEGIVAGARARGLKWDKWDVLAFNAWGDIPVYEDLYWSKIRSGVGGHVPLPLIQHQNGGCSAFVATGSYTTDGQIVMGHNTWAGYADCGWCNVIVDLKPIKGYRIIYQSYGASVWSGPDWIYNEAGLMVTETTLPDMYVYNPKGTPVFVRERYALQYASSIDEYIQIMTYKNNGGYANDWLVGDAKTGEICSLELGTYHWKVTRTFDGFITSCNYPKSDEVRSETVYDWTDPTTSGYCRTQRWKQLYDLNTVDGHGKHMIDVTVGMAYESDHWDTYLSAEHPSERTLCGHGETETGPPYAWGEPWPDGGACDGKVMDSVMLLKEMGMWGLFGHPCGTAFDVSTFLVSHPECAWELPYLHDFGGVPWTYFKMDMQH